MRPAPSQEIIDTEEESPSFAESWRTAHKVRSLQRIWWSLPFLATSLIGFVTLASLLYEQKFDLDERARGVAAAVSEPFQLVGLVDRRAHRDPTLHRQHQGPDPVRGDGRDADIRCVRRLRLRPERRTSRSRSTA